MITPKIYIIHVSNAFERETHMRRQIAYLPYQFEFINRGDISDLSDEVMSIYFTQGTLKRPSAISCAYKHILAYQELIKDNNEWALILEDDIFFEKNAPHILNDILKEIQTRKISSAFISLENSTLKRISKEDRIPDQIIYKKDVGRCAGAYLIDKTAAQNILTSFESERCSMPIDWYHNVLSEKGCFDFYWSEPPIAEQGSHNGKLESLMEEKDNTFLKTYNKKLKWALKKIWSKLRF